MYPPGSTPPPAEASLGSMEFNPKIPNESEELQLGSPLGKSSSSPVGYRGEVVVMVSNPIIGRSRIFWVILVFLGAIFGLIRFSETPNEFKFSPASAKIWQKLWGRRIGEGFNSNRRNRVCLGVNNRIIIFFSFWLFTPPYTTNKIRYGHSSLYRAKKINRDVQPPLKRFSHDSRLTHCPSTPDTADRSITKKQASSPARGTLQTPIRWHPFCQLLNPVPPRGGS